MGDYIDRGPDARDVLVFVRELTVRFPQQVHALLGNHELLRDVLTIVSGGAVEGRVVSDVEGIAARVDARIGRAVASAASREA